MFPSLLRVVVCVSFAFWIVTAGARPTPPPAIPEAAVEEVVAKSMREQNIPGMAVGILHEGKLIYGKGFGKANVEWDIPVTTDTVFLVGSISKPMLAVGIALLAEQGKLSLDDLVSKHIPGTPPTWSAITLRHLLNHTSGIKRESPAFDGNKTVADLALIEATFPLPLDFPTGSKSQYCNICYFTLAEVMARVSGEPWPRFMTRAVFAPAGMTATRTSSNLDVIPRRAASYNFQNGVLRNTPEWTALRPSGAFASNLNDMERWEAALHHHRILKPETLAAMAEPARLPNGNIVPFGTAESGNGYGLGWVIGQVSGHRRIAHGGALAGFRSLHARYPDSAIAIVLLTNSANARVEVIEAQLAKLVLPATAR